MNKEFKKIFFTSLLAVLLIISNLIGAKLTNLSELIISVDFLTYPFTFLCTLLIYNLGGKKSAYQGVLIAALIQVFITISYTLAIKLGNQAAIPDMSLYVNEMFKVKELNILASLLGFLSSHYVLIYIYENFKKCGKELYGVVIGLLAALLLNTTIVQVISLNDQGVLFIVNMLLSNIIISIFMLICLTIVFYLLKEKEQDVVLIESMNIKVNTEKNADKSIEELISVKSSEKTRVNKPKKYYSNSSNKKTSKNSNKNTKSNSRNIGTKKDATKKNQSKKSQSKVNKTNKK